MPSKTKLTKAQKEALVMKKLEKVIVFLSPSHMIRRSSSEMLRIPMRRLATLIVKMTTSPRF